jgi:hypothetical protein
MMAAFVATILDWSGMGKFQALLRTRVWFIGAQLLALQANSFLLTYIDQVVPLCFTGFSSVFSTVVSGIILFPMVCGTMILD